MAQQQNPDNTVNLQPKHPGKSFGFGKNSAFGIIIASICILVYLGALVSVIIRINTSMEKQQIIAEQEFYDIADLATSAGVSGFFMDEEFTVTIQKALSESTALEGLIIYGSKGEYPFEKERGKAIVWVNNSPRFRNRFDFSRQPLYLPLRIQNLRNVNIQAVAGALDYNELAGILKQAMFLVAASLGLAFLTLLTESLRKKGRNPNVSRKNTRQTVEAQPGTERPGAGIPGAGKPAAGKPGAGKPAAGGSYSQRGRVVREENTEIRLNEELQRCVAGDHDLTFLAMELKIPCDDAYYARFAADAARFFSSRDFVCEKGAQGISVICPALSLDAGFLNADEFHNRVMGKYPGLFKSKTDLCMGISSRSGRPVSAERLIFEAEESLERAMMDPVSHIVAFKSDPEKYKAFMESQGQNS
jgi:hypothetical protein